MRTLLLLLGIFHAANGVVMLAVPAEWYLMVPGVTETGPANLHFIRDIGLGFLAAGLGLVIAARRENGSAALAPAAVFLGGHAVLHLAGFLEHGAATGDALRDTILILIPGLLPVYALWRRRDTLTERSVR